LVLGSFTKGAIEHSYLHSFQQLGIELTTFDISGPYYFAIQKHLLNKVINRLYPDLFLGKINQGVIEFCKSKVFDVILVFKGHTLYTATLQKIKSQTRLLCCYNPDHPLIFFSRGSGNKHVTEGFPIYHIHFSYARSIVKTIKEQYNREAFWIPFGFDAEMINKGKNIPARTGDYFLFYGAYDRQRAALLNTLAGINLKIFGNSYWQSKTKKYKNVQKAFQGTNLYSTELVERTREANGVLNILREQNLVEESHNMRTFEVPGCGGLLISNYTKEQAEFFVPGKEALYYRSPEELRSILEEISKNKPLTQQIKNEALKRCISDKYSYFDRAQQMIGIMRGFL